MDLSGHFTRMWTQCGRCELFGTGCILDRASSTKETLSDFREWCRVTQHPRVFRRLMGCQRDPREMGRHISSILVVFKIIMLNIFIQYGFYIFLM